MAVAEEAGGRPPPSRHAPRQGRSSGARAPSRWRRALTSLPQCPAQWGRRGLRRSRAWRGPGERGSFETGTDGRACSEGNKQIPGGSGRETWNVYAALKQETENIHHVQHPSYRGEIPAALHASQDLSEARDSCSLKDDDVLLLRQFGHRGLQLKPHPGTITARRQQARVLLDMATFH